MAPASPSPDRAADAGRSRSPTSPTRRCRSRTEPPPVPPGPTCRCRSCRSDARLPVRTELPQEPPPAASPGQWPTSRCPPARAGQPEPPGEPQETEVFFIFTRAPRRRPERPARPERQAARGARARRKPRQPRRARRAARASRATATGGSASPAAREEQPAPGAAAAAGEADRPGQPVRGPDGAQAPELSPGGRCRTHAAAIRLDKWLWQARFCKSRALAARLIADGAVRVNAVRVVKPATAVRVGDGLSFAHGGRVRAVRIRALGTRRGPATEARRSTPTSTPRRARRRPLNPTRQADT